MPQKYFHDKFILLLASGNAFLTFLCTVLILLRVGVGQGSSDYIVQYRANLGISSFKPGDFIDILSFIGFAVIVLALSIFLSIRTYHIHRSLAVVVLCLGTLLLLAATIISNSLLGLR